MTIDDLINHLKLFPGDMEVILSNHPRIDPYDAEFYRLKNVEQGHMTWNEHGWLDYFMPLVPDSDYGLERGERASYERVVCLWPRLHIESYEPRN